MTRLLLVCAALAALVACSDGEPTVERAEPSSTSATTMTRAPNEEDRLADFLADHPTSVVHSRIVYQDGPSALVALPDELLVVSLAGGTHVLATVELPRPHFEIAGDVPVDTFDVTEDGRTDFLVHLAAADTIPGMVVSDDGGDWRLIRNDRDRVELARDAEIAGGYLRTHHNDCTPTCAAGTTTRATLRFDRDADRLVRSDGDDTCAGREQSLHADVDGDGRPDVVWVQWLGTATYTGVCTAGGTEMRLAAGGESGIRAVDVEGDGRSEIVGGGTSASASYSQLLVFADGGLQPIDLSLVDGFDDFDDETAIPATFRQWGCDDVDGDGTRDLVQLVATRDDDGATVSRTGYRLEDTRAIELTVPDDRLDHFPTGNERLVPEC